MVFLTLEKFELCPAVGEIILVVPEAELAWIQAEVGRRRFQKLTHIVPGGDTRFQSVLKGLAGPPSFDLIAIHDGVRPLVRSEKIQQVIAMAAKTGAAILAVAPKDTIKAVQHRIVTTTLDRSQLCLAQTPQVFRKQLILAAYRNALEKGIHGTDDATLVELLGETVVLVEGDQQNIKITTQEDFLYAQFISGLVN